MVQVKCQVLKNVEAILIKWLGSFVCFVACDVDFSFELVQQNPFHEAVDAVLMVVLGGHAISKLALDDRHKLVVMLYPHGCLCHGAELAAVRVDFVIQDGLINALDPL